MSYDIDLKKAPCPTCGHEDLGPDLPNPTYNLTPIFDFALTGEDLPSPQVGEMGVVLFGQETDRPRGLRVLNGKTGKESLTLINAALDRMADTSLRARFIALQPENGWGDLPGAQHVMTVLQDAAQEYPDHVWEIR